MASLGEHLRPRSRRFHLAWVLAALFGAVFAFAFALAVLLAPALAELPLLGSLCAILVVATVGLGLAGGLVAVLRGRRRAVPAGLTNDDAIALLRLGRYDEAANAWEDLCHAGRANPAMHALFVFNLGMAQLHRGRPHDAIQLIESARSSGWFDAGALAGHSPHVDAGLALACALRGEVSRAEGLAGSVRARVIDARHGMIALAEAVVAAREGRPVELDAALRRSAEASLMAIHVRALELLEAFTRSGGDHSAYRSPARDGESGARRGELDFLAAEWPALRAFLDARAS